MEIRKEDLAAIEAASNHVDAHASLKCVRVEPGRLVATDGRILVIRDVAMEDGEEQFEPFLLDGKAFKAAASQGGFLRAGNN